MVLFSELNSAESKSQVYANLHEFLRTNPTATSKLGS